MTTTNERLCRDAWGLNHQLAGWAKERTMKLALLMWTAMVCAFVMVMVVLMLN